ncbi:hypothetical protein BHE74_00057839, partial [Ensete ventricosum]
DDESRSLGARHRSRSGDLSQVLRGDPSHFSSRGFSFLEEFGRLVGAIGFVLLILSFYFPQISFCYTERLVRCVKIRRYIWKLSVELFFVSYFDWVLCDMFSTCLEVLPTFAALFPFAKGLELENVRGLQ